MPLLELVTPLPPGTQSHTRLGRHGPRLVVLRELKEGTVCFYPEPSSPQVVTLQEVGELQGKRQALFAYVPGVSLKELAHAFELVGQPIPLGLLGAVAVAGCRALASVKPPRAHGGLHDAVLHVGFDGVTWLLDFGAPRVTRFRPLGRDNFAADVFAMGGVLHSLLTGYEGEYASAGTALVRPSVCHPEATPALDDVVLRALSPQPDSRQHDVGALSDELEAVLGPQLFPVEQISGVVRTLFRDRKKLLESLSGLTAGPGEDREFDPSTLGMTPESRTGEHDVIPTSGPLAPIPMRTQPGTPASAEVTRAAVPWDSGEVPPVSGAAAVDEGGTQPRIEVRAEPATNPGVEAPQPRSSPARPPPGAQDHLPEGLRATADPLPQVGPRPSAPSRVKESEVPTAFNPMAGRPRASAVRAAVSEPPASGPGDTGDDEVESTAAGAGPRAAAEDTAPRARPPLRSDETDPRAQPPALGDDPERAQDTAVKPRPPQLRDDAPAPRNTTTHERLRARGQERVPTPPEGLELGAGLDEPTAVKRRPKQFDEAVEEVQTAETKQKLKVVTDEDVAEASATATAPTGAPRRGRGVIAVLLLVLVGLGVAYLARRSLSVPPTEPPQVVDEPLVAAADTDAGEDTAHGDAGDVDEDDDGGVEDSSDGGDDDEVDAGAAGLVDAGAALPDAGHDGQTLTSDAGVKVQPVTTPAKKKKKKKRRR